MQNNLASYILSNKNLFLPPLITYRAVRDIISETNKFASSEDLRFANSEDFSNSPVVWDDQRLIKLTDT